MSGRSVTSGSVRSLGGSVRLGTGAPGHEVVLDSLYDRKRDKKTVRVLTVIIYVFSVSLAAIMLSLYYVFFWEPKDAQYAQRKVSHTVEKQTSTTPMPTCLMPYTGGGNISMNDAMQEPFANASDFAHNSSGSERDNGPSTDPIDLTSYFDDPPNSTTTEDSAATNDTTFDSNNSVT